MHKINKSQICHEKIIFSWVWSPFKRKENSARAHPPTINVVSTELEQTRVPHFRAPVSPAAGIHLATRRRASAFGACLSNREACVQFETALASRRPPRVFRAELAAVEHGGASFLFFPDTRLTTPQDPPRFQTLFWQVRHPTGAPCCPPQHAAS